VCVCKIDGISSTEILYWEHYIGGDSNMPFFPYQEPKPGSTFNLVSTPDWYGHYEGDKFIPAQTLNNVTLAITIHQIYDSNNRFLLCDKISPSLSAAIE